MTQEEFKALADKIAAGLATDNERLVFVKELNMAVADLRKNIKNLKK